MFVICVGANLVQYRTVSVEAVTVTKTTSAVKSVYT